MKIRSSGIGKFFLLLRCLFPSFSFYLGYVISTSNGVKSGNSGVKISV